MKMWPCALVLLAACAPKPPAPPVQVVAPAAPAGLNLNGVAPKDASTRLQKQIAPGFTCTLEEEMLDIAGGRLHLFAQVDESGAIRRIQGLSSWCLFRGEQPLVLSGQPLSGDLKTNPSLGRFVRQSEHSFVFDDGGVPLRIECNKTESSALRVTLGDAPVRRRQSR